MRNIKLFGGLIAVILFCGCVQFKTASLYEGEEQEPNLPPPARISQVVEPIIFNDDPTNFWVTDDPNCTTGGVTEEVVYSGEKALKINWNRDPSKCKWAGFGIGWDDWSGKDLTEVFDAASIQFYVRSQEGKMYGLPCVLTLEDYSGKMGWSYTSLKYFENYYIDEEWQRVLVPLNTFDIDKEGINLANIKQLSFELQAAGGIYIDDISLVYDTPEEAEPWLEEEKLPDPLAFPIQLFDEEFINDNGWGIMSDHCQNIEWTTATQSQGKKSIHAKWDKNVDDCYLVSIGVSWNRWFRVDLSQVASTTMIEFDIRTGGPSFDKLPVKVGFEDYERRLTLVELRSEFIDEGKYDSTWRRVRVPLSALQGDGDFSDIKQLVFRMEDAGEIYLDNLVLVRNSG